MLCGLAIAAGLFAQGLSQLSGSVTDNSGAVITGAKLTARNTATGAVASAATSNNGTFVLPNLAPGPYELECEMAGFKKFVQTGLVVETGISRSVEIRLEVGQVSERVEITATAPLLESSNSTVGQLIERTTVANMPIESQRGAALVRLMGNVVFVSETGSEAIPRLAMGGGRTSNQMWNLDGSALQNMTLGVPILTLNPPAESLQEFKAETSNYSAEFGRAASGLINMTTRSGSNDFHGAAYEFLRNEKLDTRNFFAARRAPLRYNIFGASISGPVRLPKYNGKDKTFFFFNYQGARRRDGWVLANNTVPRPAELNGDFSQRLDTVVRDPFSATPAAPGMPFPGNIIPASRLDPVGSAVAKLFPAPNVASDPTRIGVNNFSRTGADQLTQDFFVTRWDHNFNQNNRLYVRYMYVKSIGFSTNVFPTEFADFRASRQENDNNVIYGSYTRNFRSNLFNEVRVNIGRRSNFVRVPGTGSNQNQTLGIRGVLPENFARFNLPGYSPLGSGAQARFQFPIDTRQIQNTSTWIRGNHVLRFGGEFRYSKNDDINAPTGGGQFNFINRAGGGDSLVELLTGFTGLGRQEITDRITSKSDYWAAFIQDDWRVSTKLTLNFGLRWEMDTPRNEANNRQSGFDPLKLNPVSNTPGVINFAGRDGVGKYAHNFDKNNYGPRFGFAYRLNEKTVVRGGYGLMYNGIYSIAVPFILFNGFGTNTQVDSPDGGFTAAFRLRDGLPTVARAELGPGFGAVPLTRNPTTATGFFQQNHQTGYAHQFNFVVQRALANNFAVEAAYQASLGHRLGGQSYDFNEIPLVDGRGPAVQDRTRRRFPQFANVTHFSPPWGNSSYHSLNIKLDKRYSIGFNLLGNFTWSKFIDDVQDANPLGGSGAGYQHSQLRALDKALAGMDIRRRLMLSTVYDLPWRKGGKWAIRNRALNAIAGDWGVSLISELRDGVPFGVSELVNTSNAFSPGQRSNLVGQPTVTQGSRAAQLARYFDTSAFAAPGAGNFGNAPRTGIIGPGFIGLDANVHKRWTLREPLGLMFRVDMYNLPNRPNFGLPAAVRGRADFGRIADTLAGSTGRLIQLSLRLEF